MIYGLELTAKIFVAIKKQKWERARLLVDELKVLLETYRDAC